MSTLRLGLGLTGMVRWTIRLGQGLLVPIHKAVSRLLLAHCVRAMVYVADAEATFAPKSLAPLEFRSLPAEELQALPTANEEFREKQLRRLQRFGESHAYGVFLNGELTHISWLLPPDAMRRDAPRIIRGGPDEAEITGCETLPEFRGRGIYAFAIQNLVQTARLRGLQRVYMKTAATNVASQRGIEKAGLEQLGSALVVRIPLTERRVIVRRFG